MAEVRRYRVTYVGGCANGVTHVSTDDQVPEVVAIGNWKGGLDHYRRTSHEAWDVTYEYSHTA